MHARFTFCKFCACVCFFFPVSSKKQRSWLGPEVVELPAARASLGMTALTPSNGKHYIFGGFGNSGVVNDLHEWDSLALTCTNITSSVTGSLPTPRSGLGMTSLNSKVYIFGGRGRDYTFLHGEFCAAPDAAEADFLNDLYEWDPITMKWTNLTRIATDSNTPTKRFSHGFTATNGKLFVFGGWNGVFLNDLFAWDLAIMVWANITPSVGDAMPNPRRSFGFAAAHGALYLFGGESETDYFNDFYMWDVSNNTWTAIDAFGTTPAVRIEAGFTTANGKLYLVGGYGFAGNLGDLSEWDPATNVWTVIFQLPDWACRRSLGLTSDSRKLYMFGGYSQNGGYLNTIIMWDLTKSYWTHFTGNIEGSPPPATGSTGLTTANNKIYQFGGEGTYYWYNTLYEWDPEALLWSSLSGSGAPPEVRVDHGFASVNDKLYVYGGLGYYGILTDLHKWDLASMTWTELTFEINGTAPPWRRSFTFTSLNDKIYLFGGDSGAEMFNDLHEFDPSLMTWTDLSSSSLGNPPSPRSSSAATSANGKLYVHAGYASEGLSDLHEWDSSTNTWTDLSGGFQGTLPSSRSLHSFTYLDGKLYMFGGWNNGVRGDLYVLDPLTMAWSDLTGSIAGTPAKSRYLHAMTSHKGKLYLFGGTGINGLMDDFLFLEVPREVVWPVNGSLSDIAPIFDWDNIVISEEGTLLAHLPLCTGVFPCTLDITGRGRAILKMQGSISCSGVGGCIGITMDSSNVVCIPSESSFSVFNLQGSTLNINNSTFSGCSSQTDGAAIRSYDSSTVIITSCLFQNMQSAGFGGAISLISSSLLATNATFIRCTSNLGGGAIWTSVSSSYQPVTLADTESSIESSVFYECTTKGTGGAILASSDCVSSNQSLLLTITATRFLQCVAEGNGGAIRASGGLVIASSVSCTFTACRSAASGGAMSINSFARMNLKGTSFEGNSATGIGGGALHVQNAYTVSIGSQCIGNTAHLGGGGALFWQGDIPPNIYPLCRAGAWGSEYNPTFGTQWCQLCPAGTFQTGQGMIAIKDCIACLPGTHSNGTGASACLSCPFGKYSTASRAGDSGLCTSCAPGTYSHFGASHCSACLPGTYASEVGATTCLANIPGTTNHTSTDNETTLHHNEKTQVGNMDNSSTHNVSKKDNETISRRGRERIGKEYYHLNKAREISEGVERYGSDLFCVHANDALYGSCVASAYAKLQVEALPTLSNPAFPGLQYKFSVTKKDFYEQTILSDSSSLLQTLAATGVRRRTDGNVLVSGSSTANFYMGRAEFFVAIIPTFSHVDPARGLTILQAQPQIFVQGVDAESSTSFVMRSEVLTVYIANGTAVCPIGSILVLDSTRKGSCSKCAPGTYSLSPLAGLSVLQPSCFNCPLSGICKGGFDVHFTLGEWVESGNMYRLIGCPPGHQLVNSINGLFSHDVQNCLPCSSNQYVIDSNNPNFNCETCPTGAKCDGKGLQGILLESVWVADMTTGKYRLSSCPVGYIVQISSQESQLCSQWSATTFVAVEVSLPMTLDEFDVPKQSGFKAAIAGTAAVHPNLVMIASVSQARRSTTGSLQINTNVAADNVTAATAISNMLLLPSLNVHLAAEGLPSASQATVVVVTASSADNYSKSTVVGASMGGFIFLIIAAAGGYLLTRKIRLQSAQRAFLVAVGQAKAGEEASMNLLPVELRREYIPQRVAGKGAFGCVLDAIRREAFGHAKLRGAPSSITGSKIFIREKSSSSIGTDHDNSVSSIHRRGMEKRVAIKMIVPSKSKFDERELRHLTREATVLDLFTSKRCAHAVNLAGVGSVHIVPDLCWFIMELLDGDNLDTVFHQEPFDDVECIKVARSVLAALKIMHAEGLVHRDIKPSNIVRCSAVGEHLDSVDSKQMFSRSFVYKLIDFGTALGVDETLAKDTMMTITGNRQMGAGTPPYMSPEMFKEPELALYPTDLWSLGVTIFEIATCTLPFEAENEFLWSIAVAGNMDARAPSVLDRLGEDRRAMFDHSLAKVIATALEKQVPNRYQSADEMHNEVYSCLIKRGEAFYSVFISYRVASEAPLARLLFDDLNHSVTPGGHRVTVYWDAHRLVKGEGWEEGFATGLLNSLCFFPLLSYGATAPLAALPDGEEAELAAKYWEVRPFGRPRLRGLDSDPEDNVLKELLIATSLLDRRSASNRTDDELGLLQLAYPIFVGRQQPSGHPEYPGMGDFFHVQGGGGRYPKLPSPPTARAVTQFLKNKAHMPSEVLQAAESRSVETVLRGLTALQGCKLWAQTSGLAEADLSKEQLALVGHGYAGPAVNLDGVVLTAEQLEMCSRGLDIQQLRMLKAQVRAKRADFHEVIDRAVEARAVMTGCSVSQRATAAAAAGAQPQQEPSLRRAFASGMQLYTPAAEAGAVLAHTDPQETVSLATTTGAWTVHGQLTLVQAHDCASSGFAQVPTTKKP